MSTDVTTDDTGTELDRLQRARERLRDVESEIADVAGVERSVVDSTRRDADDSDADGSEPIERVESTATAVKQFERLLSEYESSATGTGDFGSYVEFQGRLSQFVDGLDGSLPQRERFEEASEELDQRRLNETHFERARETIAPARRLRELLGEREDARKQYGRARRAVLDRRDELADRVEQLRRLREITEMDLDAPIDRLREPIEAYNDAVDAEYQSFASDAGARELLELFEDAAGTPLVQADRPPADLMEYVREYEAGTDPVHKLLEYADYSTSKLDHYVDDVGALRARVATHRTYLERLDADPFLITWPPAPAEELRYRTRELLSLIGAFASDESIAHLRAVQELTRAEEYEPLRTVASALDELDDRDRELVEAGDVGQELERTRRRRDEFDEALEMNPTI